MGSNERELIVNYLKGDKEALEILIQRYLKPVYNFIYRYVGNEEEAEDITQEVFVRVWRNLKKFDLERNFKTWVFSIAKNAAIDFLRKKKTLAFSEFENEAGDNFLTETLADPTFLPDELLARKDLGATLTRILEKLSPKYREVLLLRYNDHFTFREIAESLGEELNTVKSRHRRALIILQKILTKTSL